MNSIGNRHLSNNLRVLVVNNGCGAEFWLSHAAAPLFGKDTDTYIAAAGHYGNQSKTLIKHYAQDLGFKYLAANNKKEYLSAMSEFTSPELSDKPLLIEMFTTALNEDHALQLLSHIAKDDLIAIKILPLVILEKY